MINLESGKKKTFDCNSRKYLSKYLSVQALDFDSFLFSPAQIALLLFSVSIFFSYALQFYVLMEIVGPNVIRPLVPEQWYSVSDYTTRIVINIITCKC